MRDFKRKMTKEDDGSRCPLMGASKAVSMLDDAYMLIIGTEECTYYTKSTQTVKGVGHNCFSVVLDNQDVTFGSVDKVENAAIELIEEYNPKSLFLITTCVVEIVGDDFNKLREDLCQKYNIEVQIIQTNHFSGENENDGFDKVFKSSSNLQMPNKLQMLMKKMKNKGNMDKSQMMEMKRQKRGMM